MLNYTSNCLKIRGGVLGLLLFCLTSLTCANELKHSLKQSSNICESPFSSFSTLKISSDDILQKCQRVKELYAKLYGKKLFIMFASQNIYSPSSAFGHVFLRLGKVEEPHHFDLVIDYTANTEGDGGMSYIYNALQEKYKAKFNTVYLYQKMKLYSEMENRDIWQYEIPLTNEEKIKLIFLYHEIESKKYTYNFFNNNCATKIGEFIGLVTSRVTSVEKMINLPGEKLRELQEANVVKKAFLIPSKESQLSVLKNLSSGCRDLYSMYDTDRNQKNLLTYQNKYSQQRMNRIIESNISCDYNISKKNPLYDHDERRVGLRVKENSVEGSFTFGMHNKDDSFDSSLGLSSLDIASSVFQYSNKSFEVKRFTLIELESVITSHKYAPFSPVYGTSILWEESDHKRALLQLSAGVNYSYHNFSIMLNVVNNLNLEDRRLYSGLSFLAVYNFNDNWGVKSSLTDFTRKRSKYGLERDNLTRVIYRRGNYAGFVAYNFREKENSIGIEIAF